MMNYILPIYMGLIALYGFFFIWIYKKKRAQEHDSKIRFFQTLDNGFTAHLINSTKDLIQIYQGIYRGNEANLHNEALKKINEYRVYVINRDEIEEKNREFDKKNVIEKLSVITKELETADPFSFLPSVERMPFTEILEYCNSSNYEAIRNKIKDISHILQGKNETIEKITKSNKLAVPLAVMGLIFTVIFGLVSLIK